MTMQPHERLRDLVENSGMMQGEFAALMNVNVSTQRNYEKGLRKPDIEYLTRLHEAGFDVVYLITGKRSVELLSAEEHDVLAKWHQAGKLQRHIAMVVLTTGEESMGEDAQ